MRHRSGLLMGLTILLLWGTAAQGYAQDAGPDIRYWPLSDITFPVAIDRLQNAPQKPTKLHFYVNPPGVGWKEVANRGINELEVIDSKTNRRGFSYASLTDGTYDFALQLEYANSQRDPIDSEIRPQWRVIFDTKPPLVRASRLGTTGIDWDVVDDNLRPDGIQIEARWVNDVKAGEPKFSVVTPKNFRPKNRDSYTWVNIPANDPLEVRIVARDRAGHETVSAPITLPANGSAPGLGNTGGGSGTAGSGFGNPRDFDASGNSIQQPQIEFSNTKNLKIISKIEKVTRSGIVSADLWMRDARSNWTKVDSKPVNIVQSASDPKIPMDYAVPEDGRYGFIVIPVNGAGGKEPDPKANDPAQRLIEVDTTPPVVSNTMARPMGSGPNGPRVEISWTLKELNPTPNPIMIQYSSSPTGPDWKPVHIDPAFLPNTGRYVWEVEDKDLWRFYIRVTAVDLAGNRGSDICKDEVKIDLEVPKAFVEKVQPNGKPNQIRDSNRSPLVPTSAPESSPAPQPEPAPAQQPVEVPDKLPISKNEPKVKPVATPVSKPTPPATPSVPVAPVVPKSEGPSIPSLPPNPAK